MPYPFHASEEEVHLIQLVRTLGHKKRRTLLLLAKYLSENHLTQADGGNVVYLSPAVVSQVHRRKA